MDSGWELIEHGTYYGPRYFLSSKGLQPKEVRGANVRSLEYEGLIARNADGTFRVIRPGEHGYQRLLSSSPQEEGEER